MKKTAIAILIAVLVVAIGAGLVFAGLSAVNFKFWDLDTTEYVTNTHEVGESFTRVEMDMDMAGVNILPAEDGKCRVVCVEREKYPHAVHVDNGTLIVRSAKNQTWNASIFSIGITIKSPSVTLYLPAADYESLKLEADTGAVKLGVGLSFEAVDVDADTGSIRVTDVVCSGDMRIEADTGSIRLEDVDAANLYLDADTGSISGTIRTPKTFVAKSATGSVKVPDTTGEGRCEAHADTGSIRLSIVGE